MVRQIPLFFISFLLFCLLSSSYNELEWYFCQSKSIGNVRKDAADKNTFFTFLNGNSISGFNFYIEKKDMLRAIILCILTEFSNVSNVKLPAKTTISQGIQSKTTKTQEQNPFYDDREIAQNKILSNMFFKYIL